jgi:hypothetical protein
LYSDGHSSSIGVHITARSLVRASHFDISSAAPIETDPVDAVLPSKVSSHLLPNTSSITLLFNHSTVPFLFWLLFGDLSSGEPFQPKTKVKKSNAKWQLAIARL